MIENKHINKYINYHKKKTQWNRKQETEDYEIVEEKSSQLK